MSLINLGHFQICTNDLESTKKFYYDTLGLEEGYRPPFEFQGAWLYLKNTPVIHIALQDHSNDTSTDKPMDHIAFNAEAYDETLEYLRNLQIAVKENVVPETQTPQLFFEDPNGVTIELTFPFS